MKDEEKYVAELEEIIRRMLKPFKNIRFGIVIKALTGHKVIEWDRKSDIHKKLLKKLSDAADLTSSTVNKQGGIIRPRPNEVGNDLEIFVENSLREVKFDDVGRPVGKKGTGKSTGYPDREFSFKGVPVYLEIKSYANASLGTTMRSFYFSPSDNFKVNKTALHLITAFEVIKKETAFFVTGWKIITVDKLMVDVKYEFNSDNRRLYSENAVLAQRKIII